MKKFIFTKGFTRSVDLDNTQVLPSVRRTLSRLTAGFTLIELMVATSIFIIIMLMAMSSIVTSSNSAKKSQGLREAMDNVNFAMDTITRSLRIGTNYSCILPGLSVDLALTPSPIDCPPSGNTYGSKVAFTPAESSLVTSGAVAYQSAPRGDGTNTLQRCTATAPCVDIVASNVDIQVLKFFVNGSDPADTIQPSVFILMEGTVTNKDVPTSFAIQTMASQRSSE